MRLVLSFGKQTSSSPRIGSYVARNDSRRSISIPHHDHGVPRCCGAFTPSTQLVSIRQGRGWFLYRFWDRSGPASALDRRHRRDAVVQRSYSVWKMGTAAAL